MSKKRKKKAKPKIEQVKTEPELSETPVIGDKQAGIQPGKEHPETELKTEVPSEKPPIEAENTESKSTVDKSEPVESAAPVICAGCKMIVDSDTTEACLNPDCKGSLVFCPDCAKAGTCHKCGKNLDPNKD